MSDILSLKASELAQADIFQYLIAAIAPRPICFASTIDKNGKVNLSPYSFFNAFSSQPPIMVFSPARNREGKQKNTYDNVKDVPELVINVVNYPIVQQMSLASTAYDKGVNEFSKSGLTEVKSDLVAPPRVAESPVAFECKVVDIKDLGTGAGAGSLVICEVLVIHINKNFLDDDKNLDTTKLDLVGRMGANWYTRASGESLFHILKPIKTKGIGVDQLPASVRRSQVLTGNDLGQLGNAEKLPENYKDIANQDDVEAILNKDYPVNEKIYALHALAKAWVKDGRIQLALKILFLADNL